MIDIKDKLLLDVYEVVVRADLGGDDVYIGHATVNGEDISIGTIIYDIGEMFNLPDLEDGKYDFTKDQIFEMINDKRRELNGN